MEHPVFRPGQSTPDLLELNVPAPSAAWHQSAVIRKGSLKVIETFSPGSCVCVDCHLCSVSETLTHLTILPLSVAATPQGSAPGQQLGASSSCLAALLGMGTAACRGPL